MEMLNAVLLIALFVTTVRLLGSKCRECDTRAPLVRLPKNWNEAWGGWTCAECGREYGRWGEPVGRQPFPAIWPAHYDESYAPTVELQKKPSTDLERRDEYRD